MIEPARFTIGAKVPITATVKAIRNQRLSQRLMYAMSMRETTRVAPIGAMETRIARATEHALFGAGAAETTTATEISSYDSQSPISGAT